MSLREVGFYGFLFKKGFLGWNTLWDLFERIHRFRGYEIVDAERLEDVVILCKFRVLFWAHCF